jgi:CheY-like chemotaxis protein
MDIKEMFTQIRAMFAASADARGVELKFEFDPAMKVMRLGDPTRLRQAIINLVGNGLKFTTQGSVQVLVQAASGPDEVLVSVKDTGIGIAAEHIPGLFSRFSQADATTARRFGGSGLGLAITRRLIELMGGQIGVDSQVGAGSTFWFRVALPPVQPAVVPEREANAVRAEPVTVAGLKLLVAEDNAVNIMLIARLLKRFGCEVTITETGRLAVEAWNRGTFDAVFMDCQMPDMDGFEATRRIRESGARGREVPIIALTASAMDEDRERCVLAGMSEFLCKPVVPAELESMLKRVRRLRERDAADDCAAFADVLPELRRATP